MKMLYHFFRNVFCGSLALLLIASGRVRRAKYKALHEMAVTAIYFHNPNKSLFARCLAWLSKNGYTFISDTDLIQILRHGRKPPQGAVWLSFDDGFKELLENVVPLSYSRKIPITIFVPSGIVAGRGLFPWLQHLNQDARQSITRADVTRISSFPGVSIGSHTVRHSLTTNLSEEETRLELADSKRDLESWSGRAVTSFAYPEGRISGREGRLLQECGYEMAATTEATLVTPDTDPFLVPRFHVGDNISLPEAICNMAGVWRPAIDPPLRVWRGCTGFLKSSRRAWNGRSPLRSEKSA